MRLAGLGSDPVCPLKPLEQLAETVLLQVELGGKPGE